MAAILQQITFFNDEVGRVLPNAKIYSYELDDENTPKKLYLDKDLTIDAPYPLQATARGIFPQFYGDGNYLFVYTDENDVEFDRRDLDSNVLEEGDGGILTTPTNGASIDESDPDQILIGGIWDVLISGPNAPSGKDNVEVQPIRGTMIVANQDGDGDTYQRFYSEVSGRTYESSISDRDGLGDRLWFEQISDSNFSSFTENFAIANGEQDYTGDKNYTSGTITYDGNTIDLINSAEIVLDDTSSMTIGDSSGFVDPVFGITTIAQQLACNSTIAMRDLSDSGGNSTLLNVGGDLIWNSGITWLSTTMEPTVTDGLNVMRNMQYTVAGSVADGATANGADLSFIKFNSAGTITTTSAATGTWQNVSGGTINQDETGMFVKIS